MSNNRISACFVGDESGSMYGDKSKQQKQAIIAGGQKLSGGNHEFAYVVFGVGIFGVEIACKFTHDIDEFKNRVNSYTASGGTPMLKALRKADNVLHNASGERVIILATDGHSTDASTSEILSFGSELEQIGVRIICVAIGDDADREFLRNLASSDKDFHHAKFSGDLVKTYTKITAELVSID